VIITDSDSHPLWVCFWGSPTQKSTKVSDLRNKGPRVRKLLQYITRWGGAFPTSSMAYSSPASSVLSQSCSRHMLHLFILYLFNCFTWILKGFTLKGIPSQIRLWGNFITYIDYPRNNKHQIIWLEFYVVFVKMTAVYFCFYSQKYCFYNSFDWYENSTLVFSVHKTFPSFLLPCLCDLQLPADRQSGWTFEELWLPLQPCHAQHCCSVFS